MRKGRPHTIEVRAVSGNEGQWVVLVNNKQVGSSNNAKEMFELADTYPEDEDVVVTKILYPGTSFY